MSSDSSLLLVRERGWYSGLVNMLRKENGTWWRTRKWWVQSLVWLLIANGLTAFALWVIPLIEPEAELRAADTVGSFMSMLGIAAPLGVMVLFQSIIVREKQMGTAAWILSNPVSRVAFVLAKLIAHAFGCLAIIIALQGLVVYVQYSLHDGAPWPPLPLAAAMGLQALNLLFFMTFSLMLGAFLSSRGPVIGISLVVWFVQQILSQLEGVVRVIPLYMPAKLTEMATEVALGEPLRSTAPVLTATALSVLFVLVAIWRFGREEF
jgi:ABC-2 type transport system permease protein